MRTGSDRYWRRWDVIAVAGLLAWLLFDLTARTVFGSVPWPQSVVDYRILYDGSRHVFETHTYPTDNPYPYPPPAVAVHAAGTVFPFGTAVALWLALTGIAAAVCYLAAARALGLNRRPGLLVLLPLAHVVGAYYFQWDMRSVNCNLILLAAIVLGCRALVDRHDAAAGLWFALAVALKVLPVLVLPYLAWTRRWRATAWAVVGSLVLWVAVPAVAFGPVGAREVYRGWVTELGRATDAGVKTHHPILISLDKAALHLSGGDAGRARLLSGAVCAAWVLVGLAGAASCWGNRERDAASVLTHVALLVVGPAAVNPYLEPYHLVPLIHPALVLLVIAVDRERSARARLFAVGAFAVSVVVTKVPNPFELRGLVVNVQSLILCGAAVTLTWRRAREVSHAQEVLPTAGVGGRSGLLARLSPRAKV